MASLLVVVASVAAAAGALYGSLPDVRDARARVAGVLITHRGSYVHLASSTRVARAIVAVEDERFFSHGAIDPIAVARVVASTVTSGSVDPGGSTIAQQLAKTLYSDGAESFGGRLSAIGLAYKLEQRYSKPDILNLYLNAIYFGHGYYGIDQASHGYFGESPARLSWGQATLLAGLPQAPSAYDPFRHIGRARARQWGVLRQLVGRGVLTAAEATRISGQTLRLGA